LSDRLKELTKVQKQLAGGASFLAGVVYLSIFMKSDQKWFHVSVIGLLVYAYF